MRSALSKPPTAADQSKTGGSPSEHSEPKTIPIRKLAQVEPEDAGKRVEHSFAEVDTFHIVDSDLARALTTRALLERLARQLGIKADQVHVRVDGKRLDAKGGGLMDAGVVHLDPQIYDPNSSAGRRLLAHEVSHTAQRLVPRTVLGRSSFPLAALRPAAEVEAESVARSFAERQVAPPVRVPIALEAMAASQGFDEAYADLSKLVRQSHSPEIEKITDLMSYGLFDWAVTDADVEEALHILAMSPMLVARAIAANIEAKYRRRLIDNLSPQHYASHQTEILAVAWAADASGDSVPEWSGLETKILNPLPLRDLDELESAAVAFIVGHSKAVRDGLVAVPEQAARVQQIVAYANSPEAAAKLDADAATALKSEQDEDAARKLKLKDVEGLAEQIIKKLSEWVVTDSEALALLDQIAQQLLKSLDPSLQFRALANAIGDKNLDELIDQIPTKGLYQSEKRRRAFVFLVSMRPAFKNEQIAEDLIESPWWKFWDAYTSEEAFLAFLLVKSMPERARKAFFSAHGGGEWSRIMSKLPLNIKESDTLNFYSGGKNDKDRQSILTQLLDNDLWTGKKNDKLVGLIRMAIAAGEAEFVFNQSKAHRADQVDALSAIVKKYSLYSEAEKRTEFKEKALEGAPFWDEHIFGFFGLIGASLDFIFSSDNVDVDTFAIGGEGLNLGEFQDITGGSFMGARFSRTTAEERKKAQKENEGKQPNQKKNPKNFADVRWNIDTGHLKLRADALEIDKLAYPSGDMRLTSDLAHLNQVDLYISYMPTAHALRSLELSIGHVDIDGLLVTLPESMLTINRVAVEGLKVTIRAADQQHLWNAVPGAEGAGAALSNLWSVIIGSASPDLASSLTTPGWAMEMIVDFTSLTAEGLTTSGGTFIQKIEVDGFFLHSGGDAASYRQALQESAKRVSDRIEQEQPLAEPSKDPKGEHQELLRRLERQLKKINAEMSDTHPAGAVVDVSKISVSGIEGFSKDDKPITLSDVHGQGKGATPGLSLLTDSTTLRNLIVGEHAIPAVKGAGPKEDFSLDIGAIHAEDLTIAGGIPTPEKAHQDYDDFTRKSAEIRAKPGYEVILAVLNERATQADTYAKWAAVGVQNLEPEALGEFRTARDWLLAFERKRATVVKSFNLSGASLVFDERGVGIDADSLLIGNIQTFTPDGSPALHIAEISGDQISLRTSLVDGKPQHVELSAKSLTATGIQDAGTGAEIAKIALQSAGQRPGLHATVARKDGDTSATLESGQVTVTGVSMPAYSSLLGAELERLSAILSDLRNKDENKRLEAVRARLVELDAIRKRKSEAEQKLAKKPIGKEREAAEKELALANKDFKAWEGRLSVDQLTIDQLSISVTGLGDVLSPGYDFDQAASHMVVKGTGEGGRWFDRAEISGAKSGTGPKDQTSVDKVTIGPVSGELSKIPGGWALKEFKIPSFAVSGLEYASGTTRIKAVGETTLTGITLSAQVTSDKAGTHVVIPTLGIGSVTAKALSYEDDSLTVSITEGEFQTVSVESLSVDMPEDPTQKTTFEGAVGIERVKKLALETAVAGYRVGAKLKSDTPTTEKPAKAVAVKFGKAGLEAIDFDNLSGSADVSQAGTKSKIHLEWKRLSASVKASKSKDGKGDIYDIQRLFIGDISATKGSHWEADNAVLDIHDAVKLTGVFVNARVETTKNDKDETKVISAVINGLTVNEIDAKDVDVTLKAQPARVDKAGKKQAASDQKKFELHHGSIHKLKMTGFDLINRTGKIEVLKDVNIEKLKVAIGDDAKGAVQKGTVSFHLHGKESDAPGMGGRELSAELRKDGATVQIGTLEQLLGEDISGDVAAKAISVGKVTTGPIEITDKKVTIPDIEIASIATTSKATYNDGKGTRVEVDDAAITGIHLPRLEAEFGDTGLSRIRLGGSGAEGSMLIIDRIVGSGFFYEGTGDLPDKKGKSKTEVRAKKAELTTFTAGNIERDFVNKITKFEGGLKTAKIDGFSLLLEQTIGSTVNSKFLFADVNGSGLHANLSLADAAANGKPWVSEVSTFELDELGLTNVQYKQVDDGKVTEVKGQPNKSADVSLKGLKTKVTPSGETFIRFDDLAAHNLDITLPGVHAQLNAAELHDFALGLLGNPFDQGQKQMAAKLGRMHFEGLWVRLDQERRKADPTAAATKPGAAPPASKWVLEPLGDASADLAVTQHAAATVHIGVPVRGGTIDFNEISQPTYGVIARVGVDSQGIYSFQRPHGFNDGKDRIYDPPGGAGLTPETWDDTGPDNSPQLVDKGAVNLRQLVEGVLNAPAGTPEDPKSLDALNKVGIQSTNFKLGGGRLGQGKNFIELEAKSGGANVFEIDSVSLGAMLTLRAALFNAKQIHFDLMGKEGNTGRVEVQAFTVEVGKLGDAASGTDASGAPIFKFDVTISAKDGVINDVQWGDVAILKPDGTGLVESPTPAKKQP